MQSTTYWTDLERATLSYVTTFGEMVPVALDILEKMRREEEHIIMVCGPMSTGGLGSLRANMDRHRAAIIAATSRGWHIFDQSPFEEAILRLANRQRTHPGGYCFDILHVFYRGVFKARTLKELSFLPDWHTSVGARWEREEGPLHGMKLSDYPVEWLD